MVRHIVLFQLKPTLTESQRTAAIEDFKSGIERLPELIPFIRTIEVGTNCNVDEVWDVCLNSSFDTLDDVRRYATHPDHVAVAGRLKPYLAGRSCVDYEC
ncbi:MAG: Dabb family protein [Alloprevotella sp.]